MAKILNGKWIAGEIKLEMTVILASRKINQYTTKTSVFPTTPPTLAVVLCSNDPASHSYVNKKIQACKAVGINSFVIKPFESGYSDWANPKEHLLTTIDWLNADSNVNGILVQLPIPKECGVHNHEVFDRISPLKDVDVLNPINVGLLLQGRPRFVPCTPHGIQELLVRSGITISGKKIAIINRSDIVGKPLQALLTQDNEDANATVTLCHDHTPPDRLKEVCQSADIIVVAVGKPNFITPDMVNSKSIVIDVGINRVDGKIVGDVCHSVYDTVAAYSPVPNGVGPMTVAMLLHNTIAAQRLQFKS